MAVNEKALYANTHVLTGDPRRPLNPGDQVDRGRFSEEHIRSMQERGLVTDSHAEAQRLAGAERERLADVDRQIRTRTDRELRRTEIV